MAGITRNVYKITIKLTNNDENDEKEFVINNISQILLQNFAEAVKLPYGLSEKNHIFMLKDNYYIDNDVLKSIRGSKGEKNKYTFKDFGNKKPTEIIDEFYTPIMYYSHDNGVRLKTLRSILKYAVEHLERLLNLLGNSADDIKQKTAIGQNKEKIYKAKEIIDDTNISDANIDKFIKDVFENLLNILTQKDIMSYLKSKYDNSDDRNLDEFRSNLSNIMLKINSDPEKNINLNKLETYRYFLDHKNIDTIFETIQNSISASSRNAQQPNYGNYRPNLLNTPEMFKQIIKENIKYVYPDKTNIETLAESEEQDILLFHNILYILKKIYLLDTTIIHYEEKEGNKEISKKFYIKNLTLEQLNPFKLDKIKADGGFYNVVISFKCDIKYINQNPLLKINYIVDDTEILDKTNHLKVIEFEPKNFNKNQDFKKYTSTYIYDTFDYKPNEAKINKILNTIKMQKIIKTKEELFYNDIALNEFNDLLNIQFDLSDDIKEKNISPNIVYFLKNILKLYNGKEITHANISYFVYDTLIINDTSATNPLLNFYSISENKSINYKNFKADKIQKIFFKKIESLQDKEPFSKDKFNVYKVESKDKRIERNTYYIFILFICYKADEKGNKPSLKKRLIGEVCLNRAQILDKAFNDLFYSKFNISETFLYNKLVNLQKPKQAITAKNKEIPPNLAQQTNLEAKISGGNKTHTRKKIRRN